MSKKPLLISDCDEVLLHMVVPFQQWLDSEKHIHFDLESGDFVDALRHKHDGTVVAREDVWPLLQSFFDTEMHRQAAIEGAVDALNQISQVADIAILTNLMDDRQAARTEQLKAVGIDFPVHCNQGGKGDALEKIVGDFQPTVTVFVDDLGHQHQSVAQKMPHVWRLQMVGEPILAKHIRTNEMAHERIDSWPDAISWIVDKFEQAQPAPILSSTTEKLDPSQHA